jgi:hypothetical protein
VQQNCEGSVLQRRWAGAPTQKALFGTLFLLPLTKTDALIQRFHGLNVWRRGDGRAPHKPLLVLYALGQLQAGAGQLIPFDQLERP